MVNLCGLWADDKMEEEGMNLITLMMALMLSANGKIEKVRGTFFMLDNFWRGSVQGTVRGIRTPEGNRVYQFRIRFNRKGSYVLEVAKFTGNSLVVIDSSVVEVKAGQSVDYTWGYPGSQAVHMFGEKPAIVLFVVRSNRGIEAEHMLLFWKGVSRKRQSSSFEQPVIGN